MKLAYLYKTYGTHAILGVNTGGKYVTQYTIKTNSTDIAASIQGGFQASTGGGAIDSVINKNFNIDVDLQTSAEWKNSDTTVSFHTYYFGGNGNITTDIEGYGAAYDSWSVSSDNATAYGLTKDGAINLGYLIDAVDHSLAEKFNASIDFDKRLVKEDITGSIAHARMLGNQGIIPKEDSLKIIAGLEEITEGELFIGDKFGGFGNVLMFIIMIVWIIAIVLIDFVGRGGILNGGARDFLSWLYDFSYHLIVLGAIIYLKD